MRVFPVFNEGLARGRPHLATGVADGKPIYGNPGRVLRKRDERALCTAWFEQIAVTAGAGPHQRMSEYFEFSRLNTIADDLLFAVVGGTNVPS